jgi:hypothetical protein
MTLGSAPSDISGRKSCKSIQAITLMED